MYIGRQTPLMGTSELEMQGAMVPQGLLPKDGANWLGPLLPGLSCGDEVGGGQRAALKLPLQPLPIHTLRQQDGTGLQQQQQGEGSGRGEGTGSAPETPVPESLSSL